MTSAERIPPSKSRSWCRRGLLAGLTLIGVPLMLLAPCQSGLIYFPRPYRADTTELWRQKTAGKPVHFQTAQGRQCAFLQGNLKSPRNLWIVSAGNGSVALDWSDWLAQNGPKQDAYLLVDFPGYGNCEGTPSPGAIRESFRAALPATLRELGSPVPLDSRRLRFFGHSLGAGASLIAASECHIQRGVLIAPFTSTMDMCRKITGLPLGFLIWHRFDNAARLAELAARGPGKVLIFHGGQDEVIPVSMSRQLAAQHPQLVTLKEIPNGLHNTIQESHAAELSAAMNLCAGDR